MWRRYLLWFAHEHVDFRHAEMNSILSMFDIPVKFVEKPCIQKPYWIIELPSEECVKKIASRSVLMKNCVELWSKAKTEDQLHNNLRSALENHSETWLVPNKSDVVSNEPDICPRSLIESCCHAEKSFKVEVETFCKHFTMKEKVVKIEVLVTPRWGTAMVREGYLPLKGPVKLNSPDVTLGYFEYYGADCNNVPDEPYDVFFGRWIADGQRSLIKQHSLKQRQFIGNTSMDAQLAVVMANQARVTPGSLVLDPFVGSGSLLVAAAHFGAYVCGSDIDFMMLHARTRPTRVGDKIRSKEESILGNMRQYGTSSRYLDVVVADFSRALWRDDVTFDAIITDPPYGVREPTERIGIARADYTLSPHHLPSHIPAKVEYGLEPMYQDLLEFAAQHLAVGNRLVCWYPLVREEYSESCLPSHPALELVSNSEQVLSKMTCRRLLTYERRRGAGQGNGHGERGGSNFRDKYFAAGDMTRRERRDKSARHLAENGRYSDVT